jgi:hypothetical protein
MELEPTFQIFRGKFDLPILQTIFTVSDSGVHARHLGWVSVDVGAKLTPPAQSETIHKTALFMRCNDVEQDLHHQLVLLPKTSQNSTLPS